jgi:hypothetical protein
VNDAAMRSTNPGVDYAPRDVKTLKGFDTFGMPWRSDDGDFEILCVESLRDDAQLRTDLEAAEAIYCSGMTFDETRAFAHGFVVARVSEGRQ